MIWINAKERLPEESGWYLVILDGGHHITDLSYSARHKAFNAFDCLSENTGAMNDIVAYWAEIPELPEEFRKD